MNRALCTISTLFFLLPLLGYSQITMPLSRMVFQRDNGNHAQVPVQGNCPTSASSFQVKATAINGGQSVDWTTIGSASNGAFSGSLTLTGGWYSLQVRALAGGSEVGNWTLDRVGVGEVFITAGQSNQYGSPYANNLNAQDDRVSVLGYYNWPAGNIDETALPKQMVQAGNGAQSGPHGAMYIWGGLGDRLVARLGVPVMFLGASYGATSSSEWRDAANGAENVASFNKSSPYRPFGVAIMYYIKRSGVRAVLWHQGESDNNVSSQGEYVNNLTTVINKSRSQSGMGALSWVISKVSYFPGNGHDYDQNIINAQEQLIGQINNCFPGISTDGFTGPDWRSDGLHFKDSVYPQVADWWNQALSDSFFSQCQPSQPSTTPSITAGYVFPINRNGGEHIQLPYMVTAPINSGNQYTIDVYTEGGDLVGNVPASQVGNVLDFVLPVWADGRVKVRVKSSSPAWTGEFSELFTAHKTGDRPSENPTNPTPPPSSNQAPAVTASVNLGVATRNQRYDVTIPTNTFTDPENAALVYTISGLPAGLSASGLTISGTPSETGTYTIRIRATDPGNLYAETTATLVVSDGQITANGTYEGYVDGKGCSTLNGWVYNSSAANDAVVLEVVAGGRVISTQTASQFRSDLVAAGKGNGYHGYNFDTPAALKTGSDINVMVRVQNSSYVLNGGTFTLNCAGNAVPPPTTTPDPTPPTPPVTTPAPTTPAPTPTPAPTTLVSPQGWVDISDCNRQYGWARDAGTPNAPVQVNVSWDGTLVTTLTANTYRQDLATAFGDNGQHAFSYDAPGNLTNAGPHQVVLQIVGAGNPFQTTTVYCNGGARLATLSAEEEALAWRLLPNPTTDYALVTIPAAYQKAKLTVSIATMDGLIQSLSYTTVANQLKVDVSQFKTGLYLLRIEADGRHMSSLKLLKQ
ncbi:hypothetical protein GCM10028818_43150 [Spirosoma horti]